MSSDKGEKPPHPASEAANEGVHPEPPKGEAHSERKPKVVMRPKLLRAARRADYQQLKDLLQIRDERRDAPTTTQDIVLNVDTEGAAADDPRSILEGTTFQGDSALHVVATSGDGDNFKDCATLIYGKARHLLKATNNDGDTPFHCAARVGNGNMVTHLLTLATARDGGYQQQEVEELLRTENLRHETVLHEAVRLANKHMIDELMMVDPKLARHPSNGASPLYLAVRLVEDIKVAEKLHENDRDLSCLGPKGQNIVHAAVLQNIDVCSFRLNKVLGWNMDLVREGDQYGRTPLHFAAPIDHVHISNSRKLLIFIFRKYIVRCFKFLGWSLPIRETNGDNNKDRLTAILMDADESLAYQPDNNGSFPIHIAASEDSLDAVKIFLTKNPDCVNLRNAQGRTFLHVAVEEESYEIILHVCWSKRLAARIVNMQDNDGNTALHLAVAAGDLDAVLHLLMNPKVEINCLNYEGLTPLDISLRREPQGLRHELNKQNWIRQSLYIAAYGKVPCAHPRFDNCKQKVCFCKRITENGNSGSKDDRENAHEQKDSKTITESTQVMGICSTLIATVAFAAAFTLPGGYRADDHPNGGTPTFIGSYAFMAFVFSITSAFIFSLLATFSLVYSGMAKVDYEIRLQQLNSANGLVWRSIRCLLAAFALGLYVVLDPVSHWTALIVCVMCSIGLLYGHVEVVTQIKLAMFLHVRIGFKIWWILRSKIIGQFLRPFWPFIIIFGLPAYLKWRHQH